MKHIERLGRLFTCHTAVYDSTGNPPHLARLERFRHAANGKGQLPLQKQAHLLVRMTVLLDHGMRGQFNHREHQLFPGRGVDMHARKNLVVAAVSTRRIEVGVHGGFGFKIWDCALEAQTDPKGASYRMSMLSNT